MKLKNLFATVLAIASLSMPMLAEDDTPLGKEMEKISKGLKAVNRGLADASKKDENVTKLKEVKAAAEKAIDMEPAAAKDVPAAEKAKFIADYKAAMQESVKDIDALIAAVDGGKSDEAAKLMEKLNTGKKEGHKKFKKD